MQFISKAAAFDQYKTDCAVVFIHQNLASPQAKAIDSIASGQLNRALKLKDLNKKAGDSLTLYPAGKSARVVCIHTGQNTDQAISEADFRSVAASLGKAAQSANIKQLTVHLEDLAVAGRNQSWVAEQLVVAIATACYRYSETKKAEDAPALEKVTASHANKKVASQIKSALTQGAALASGINLTRNLGNLPGNICTPTYLAEQAKTLAKSHSKLAVKILDTAQMAKLGMGSLLSVAAGSEQPPKLIIMEYKGKASGAPNVIVGKGITFDTGGISLKPGPGMDEMKFDMCGAASVFGTMQALCAMNAKVNVVGVVAAAENMPSGKATKPGDVVTSMSGKTIEVLNTDAEGRLVLCDALTYVERFKPKTVVDIATLTGACVIALGNHATGLFANNQELADKLLAAGEETHDRAWQMPLWDDYKKSLKSNFADLANIGGREGGSITAACFLAHFTESYPWAHLDIAGSAWNSGGNKGATGRPVKLLVNYLLNNA